MSCSEGNEIENMMLTDLTDNLNSEIPHVGQFSPFY